MESERQVPIWFFIGSLLLIYGILILGSGLYGWAFPPPVEKQVALYYLHADIWWGALLVVLGVVYCVKYCPCRAGKCE